MTAKPYRYRLSFRKIGNLRWIGHHDLARTVERLFRRLSLPLCMSLGFHPKPKIRFVSALALGIESDVEWVEVSLESVFDTDDLLRRLRQTSPAGLEFIRVQSETSSGKFPQLSAATYELVLPPSRERDVREAVCRLWSAGEYWVTRQGKNVRVDVRGGLSEILLDNGVLRFTVAAGRQGAVRPREVLTALGLLDIESHGGKLRRVGLQYAPHGSPPTQIASAESAPTTVDQNDVETGVHPHVLKSLDEPTS